MRNLFREFVCVSYFADNNDKFIIKTKHPFNLFLHRCGRQDLLGEHSSTE